MARSAAAAASFVLDNSVAMRWCFEPAAHPYADAVLRRLAAGVGAVVPLIWFYEASAVLARAELRSVLGSTPREGGGASEFLDSLQALGIVADAGDPERVWGDVHRVALAWRLTSYHAAYLELAIRCHLPLATLDDRLIRASSVAGVTIFAP